MTICRALVDRLQSFRGREAMVWKNLAFRFDDLLTSLDDWKREFVTAGVGRGSVVAIEGDFSPAAIAALLAVLDAGAIAVPLTASVESKKPEFRKIAEVEWIIRVGADDDCSLMPTDQRANHELIRQLRDQRHPGLILFSSGSTGRNKAVIHDLELLLPKFLQPRHCYRTLAFLLFDHIGGLDTLFYNLANGSCLVTVADHSPDAVCAAIAAHRVEVLPVSPSFINLLLLSGAHERHDLRSLRIITYGAEVMPESTLARLNRAFPNVKLLQKFGATEFGTMRSQSRSSDSVWIKIGGEGYQTRVVEGVLQIKAESAMLGYLNAPSPFTEDGWFNTGDRVERDGEYFKILGRQTEIINVGGQKVYPAEVESVIQEMENVAEVMVSGEKNPILGNIVCAKVRLRRPEDPKDYSRQLRLFCRGRLQSYQVPVRIDVVENALHGERFKKMRRTEPMGG